MATENSISTIYKDDCKSVFALHFCDSSIQLLSELSDHIFKELVKGVKT